MELTLSYCWEPFSNHANKSRQKSLRVREQWERGLSYPATAALQLTAKISQVNLDLKHHLAEPQKQTLNKKSRNVNAWHIRWQ